jgi:hypothetical protein
MTVSQAKAIIKGLSPNPWDSNYASAIDVIKSLTISQSVISYWLSTGLAGDDIKNFSQALQNKGQLSIYQPDRSQYPVLIRANQSIGKNIRINILAPNIIAPGIPISIQTLGKNNHVIDISSVTLKPDAIPQEVEIDIPDTHRNKITQITLSNIKGAGSKLILDDQFKRRLVGIAAPKKTSESPPLIEDSYYLFKALEPYSDILTGTIKELIAEDPAVIILPDIGAMPADELNQLEIWVKNGGLLLRFAGPNMTQGDVYLTPVPLRKGGRALDGALTWQDPVKLAPFNENSPFFGIELNDNITVKRQMLADPIQDIEDKTWAKLEDGTPLITANTMDKGLLVFIHTTATPDWSNLALSGVYVQILRYIVNLSPGKVKNDKSSKLLHPLITLNGFGEIVQPPDTAEPINILDFTTTLPGPIHPPGLYGSSSTQKALNVGDHISRLDIFDSPPKGVAILKYKGMHEINLLPYLLSLALLLLLIDWIIMILMQFVYRHMRAYTSGILILLLSVTIPQTSYAIENDIKYASDLYLAYVSTPQSDVNDQAEQGLAALSEILRRRTSVEPKGVISLEIEHDTLTFFPFIYWPITASTQPLSDTALRKVQHYLDHGGLILFDTRDQISTPSGYLGHSGGRNTQALRDMIGNLNISPLAPMPDDHVLTKSFYLLEGFPGRYEGGTIWLEEKSISGKEGVSSIIIGGHDWAGSWGSSSSKVRLSGGPRQYEMSLRVGVNIVMYALTGNYKADQVHLPHILERLGQ